MGRCRGCRSVSMPKTVLYYLRLEKLLEFWERKEAGGRKSFTIEELEPEFYLESRGAVLVPYLDGLQRDLKLRD